MFLMTFFKLQTEGLNKFSFKGGYKLEYKINGNLYLVENERLGLKS